jgi:hypothetical protein
VVSTGINLIQHLMVVLLLVRKDKLRINKTLIQPVLSYGCQAWIMTQDIIERLAISERKILRRIFGTVYENDLG